MLLLIEIRSIWTRQRKLSAENGITVILADGIVAILDIFI